MHSTVQKRLDEHTVAGAELGQCAGRDGRWWKPVLRRGADLGQRLITFLHWTHFFSRFNPAVDKKNCDSTAGATKQPQLCAWTPYIIQTGSTHRLDTCCRGRTTELVLAGHGSG